MVLCCVAPRVAPYDGDGCDALTLGLEGAGKTLLIQRLQCLHDPTIQIRPDTFPTSGTETSDVACPGQARFKRLTMRELGGCMAPIWPRYYEECKAVVYVVDAANAAQAPAAAAQIKELLQHKLLMGKACLVVLNKVDSPSAVPRAELDAMLQLDELQSTGTAAVDTLETSALEGQGAEAVLAWLVSSKLQRQQTRA